MLMLTQHEFAPTHSCNPGVQERLHFGTHQHPTAASPHLTATSDVAVTLPLNQHPGGPTMAPVWLCDHTVA
ncbi:unnamed protein product [Rangifer tarandus platyrhynchus]|uniref:Uncharacterized protein n=1 Tax=Rangifer tarandus platyrhynchus TaxID=3082113 RepID=A0ABN8ZJ09_RANTA|nr:unnamed protein product [Rangifer tarandus platyrhynchus]